MFSVMNGSTSASNTLSWYGGTNENTTSCSTQTSTLNGNGAQLNNFVVGKDSTGAMYLTITGSASNTVSLSIQNWQNGNGCSVAPTPVSGGGSTATTAPTTAPTKTNTPVNTIAPTKTNTPGSTSVATNTFVPTIAKTNTPVNTNPPPTNPPPTATSGGSSTITVQLKGAGTDNTQETAFDYQVVNSGSSAVSGLSVRIYFTPDGSNAASGYVLEKYYDQSGVATISAPTLLCGNQDYFTVSYGTTSLAAGSHWEFQTALHLSSWGSTYDASNDFWHIPYAVGALPTTYTNDVWLPAFVSGSQVYGDVDSCGTPAPTNTAGPTSTTGPTAIPSATPVKTNTPMPTSTTVGTTVPPTSTPISTTLPPTATLGPTSSGTHQANPFAVGKWFHNPAWDAEVNASAVTAAQKATMTGFNTAVWLDSKNSVTGAGGYPYSITGWLDQAEAQGAGLIIFVVYDLPGRDCAALASNGEIPGTAAGLTDYETNYIDPIAAAMNQAKYSNLNIINIVEPDSLPNLVTNLSIAACSNVNSSGIYKTGIEYALNKLHAIPNTYNYIDIGHSGWLGWSSNFGPAITLISGVIKATNAGVSSVDGFISDTANTVPVTEPYMTATESIGGSPVQSVTFFSYNPYIEEDTYDAAWATAMKGAGLGAANVNMLVDTSRDGWGGCGGGPNVSQQCRPTAASTATDVNTFVTMSRIDRRPARGDWCNQNGAGVGFRPQANPAGGVYQAYVWIKPQGESDGASSLIPNNQGKGFDRMCDPTYGGNALNQNSPTNALPNAPLSGAWFEAQFEQLVANAFPPI